MSGYPEEPMRLRWLVRKDENGDEIKVLQYARFFSTPKWDFEKQYGYFEYGCEWIDVETVHEP